MEENTTSVVAHTADIVSAFVGQNTVSVEALPDLIRSIYATLTNIQSPQESASVEAQKPAVSVKRSITPEFLVCLEDGKQFKSLKRHLRTKYDMSPEDYRAKWGLPRDYPMVAPAYAASRSALAKSMGLGLGGRAAAKAKPAPKARVPRKPKV